MAGGEKLLVGLRRAIRLRHYSRRTEEVYVGWVRRFVRFCGVRHPRELGPREVTRFLSSLAVDRRVSASTQNQALSALVFLYGEVLGGSVGWLDAMVRAKRPLRVPVVLTRDEVWVLLERLRARGSGGAVSWLVAAVLYGTGMRLLEALRLRAKDVDFDANEIGIRGGKGDRDRVTMLPETLKGPLLRHLAAVARVHEADVRAGAGWVELPGALGLKYRTFRAAVEQTGKRRLIFGALYTEICLAFPVIDAMRDGYEAMFVVDAVGGMTQLAHRTAIERLTAAGAVPNTASALGTELFRDWKSTLASKAREIAMWYLPEVQKLAALAPSR